MGRFCVLGGNEEKQEFIFAHCRSINSMGLTYLGVFHGFGVWGLQRAFGEFGVGRALGLALARAGVASCWSGALARFLVGEASLFPGAQLLPMLINNVVTW